MPKRPHQEPGVQGLPMLANRCGRLLHRDTLIADCPESDSTVRSEARDLEGRKMQIECTVPRSLTDAIASLARTEDVRFSPNSRRLAIASFSRNRIAVFDIEIATSAAGTQVSLTGGVQLSSPALNAPHGLDFVDDDTLIVANRTGDVAIFTLPTGEAEARSCEVLPIQTCPAGGTNLLKSPGSVAVAGGRRDRREILICNNFGHTVTRHLLDVSAGYAVTSGEILLRKWLDIPDGVAVSPDRQWIAVSNHGTHNVLLFNNGPALNEHTDPDGILRRVHYPHGLRFSSDGRFLFVADAGAPDVHVYANDSAGWRGVRHPAATIRIMDESLFRRGQHNREEGGPKGLDVDAGSNVLVVTSECQPLAFFDVSETLEGASAGNPVPTWNAHAGRNSGAIEGQLDGHRSERSQLERSALEVSRELSIMEHNRTRAMRTEAELNYMRNSVSWRMTAPLRRLYSALRRLR